MEIQAYFASLLGWLDATAFAQAMRSWRWLYPAVEALHIVGFALLVGSVLLFDLRVLGLAGRALPIDALERLLLRCAWCGFAIAAPAGLLLFSADPLNLSGNPALQIKLGLIALAGGNVVFFHVRAWPARDRAAGSSPAPPAARASALLSIVVWLAVIVCGRLIAYL